MPLILRNAQVETVVRPDIGRLISFRRMDGENALWVADDPLAYKAAMPLYGGLKVMISPEVLWHQIRQEHRSDPATDGGSWTVLEQSDLHVKMQTFSGDLGVKVTWSIRIDTDRPDLSLNYEMERTEENPFPVHFWTIAQVPLEGDLLMSRLPHIPKAYHNFLHSKDLKGYVDYQSENSGLVFSGARATGPLKVGTFGRWIAHVRNEQAFIVCAPEPQKLPYADNSNLQAFSYPGQFPFYEMEHTSPLYALRVGESFQISEQWLLMDMPEVSSAEQMELINRRISRG